MGESGVGRMRDRFLLHGGVHYDALGIFGLYHPAPEALLQQRGDLLLTQLQALAAQAQKVRSRITKGISTLTV